MNKSRIIKLLILILLAVSMFTFGAEAYDYDSTELFSALSKAVPDEIEEKLPDGLIENGDASFAPGFLLKCAAELLEATVVPALRTLGLICAMLIPSAVMARLRDGMMSEGASRFLALLTVLCITLALYGLLEGLFSEIQASLEQMNLFMSAMLPMMTTLYSLGGNVMTAAVNSSSLMALFTLIEGVSVYGLYPLLRMTVGLSLLGAVGGGPDLSGLLKLVRGIFTSVIAFIMTLFSFVMAYQNKLTLSADSVASRTVKFAAVNLIPVIGSGIGEAMRALLGSFSFLKNTFGVVAVFVLLLMLLPIVIKIFMYRFVLSLSSAIGRTLGCERESALLGELNGLLAFALAVVILSGIMFIFNLTLMIKCAGAIIA